ncbi:aldehyde dehydrogenase family protein [Corynebacterium ulcerans]|uniref:aldehyde dehydrogenase family protein n=1 Tax=Corynebacterium ulcerans TaxID=65058 RepID=UPI0013036876|nr:aldehyde dehydrogenase family protein [Corynebacterium ulcerans]MBL4943507.1 aldehyde dehydrogenase family protein [Corynebacterium ulcerans]QGZ24713.1 aldehyde dehydrogenase family protein [Corynebacterium ulcerans]QOE23426.1 aldehyde dehydrogenase family protein [Corynebacterium ulcerans]
MEFTSSSLIRIPPLIHGEFDSLSSRTTSKVSDSSPLCLEVVSAAEINYRSDLFSLEKLNANWLDIDQGVFAKAAHLFTTATLNGQNFEQYIKLVSATAGLSVGNVRESGKRLAQAVLETPAKARGARRRNSFSINSLVELSPPSFGLMQLRRGNTLFVNLPGNSPGPNSVWVEALLYGYKIILRPSARDPFTPLRLAMSLIEAGVPKKALSVLYCDHIASDVLVDRCDLSIIFGGDFLEKKYSGRTDVKMYGPGRSTTIVDSSWRDNKTIEAIVKSIIATGGVACFNTSLLLLTEDSKEMESLLFDALDETTKQLVHTGKDNRPSYPISHFHSLVGGLKAEKDVKILYDGTSAELNGRVRVGPIVFRRMNRRADQEVLELPFPLVEISTIGSMDIKNLVNRSLATSLFTSDTELIAKVFQSRSNGRVLINEPTISSFRDLPHDGHLSDFLLMERPFINSPRMK